MAPSSEVSSRQAWIDRLDPGLAQSIRFFSKPANLIGTGTNKISRWVLGGIATSSTLTELVAQNKLLRTQRVLSSADFRLPGLSLVAVEPGSPAQFSALQKQARNKGFELWQEIKAQVDYDGPITLRAIREPVFNAATAPDLNGDGSAETTWHLQPSAATTSTATGNYGLNAVGAWSSVSGAGVYVGVADSTMDLSHPDLLAALPTSFDWDRDGVDDGVDADLNGIPDVFEPHDVTLAADSPLWPVNGGTGRQSHGTAASGIAVARIDGAGSIGVAPEAYWLPQANTGSFIRPQEYFNLADVTSNSWGTGADRPSRNEGTLRTLSPTDLANWQAEIAGAIVVKSAGNERSPRSTTNTLGWDNFNNDAQADRRVIAVAATMANGDVEQYSSPGANILVSAPVNGSNVAWGSQGVAPFNTVTSDVSDVAGNLTDDRGYVDGSLDWGFNGTSSATPMVAGSIALMLEANPTLTVRDVQHILVRTSQKNRLVDVDSDGNLDSSSGGAVELRTSFLPTIRTAAAASNDPYNTGWFRNGAGNWVSDSFGFGIVDAQAAVQLARTWTPVNPELHVQTNSILVSQPAIIPEGNLGGLNSLQDIGGWQVNSSLNLEWVELTLNLTTSEQDELMLVLVSPSGTRSVLMAPGGSDAVSFSGPRTLRTNQFWGESALGSWRLEALDVNAERFPDTQTIANASLDLFGTCMGGSPLHVTDYAELTASDVSLDALAREFLGLGGASPHQYRLDRVKSIGADIAWGRFSGGADAKLLVSEGFLFTSGRALDAVGPNDRTDTSTNAQTAAHTLHGPGHFDSSGLEITFTPKRDLTLRWVSQFGSEEFDEYSPSQYNDRASLYLAKVKSPFQSLETAGNVIDLLTGPSGSGYSVNDLSSSQAVFAKYAINNPACGLMSWEYDGGSKIISETKSITLKANQTYILAPIVSDASDAVYDSGLILGAQVSATRLPKLQLSTAKAFEGDRLTFSAEQLDSNSDYQWTISGSGITASDFDDGLLKGVMRTDESGSIQRQFQLVSDGLRERGEAFTLELYSGTDLVSPPLNCRIIDSKAL